MVKERGLTMVGISSYGAYLPYYRLNRDQISSAWGTRSRGGERTVANFDEDSITMAVEAGLDCIRDVVDRNDIDGLFFASTTAPYKEKQASTLIAAAMDLKREILTRDFTGTLRAGMVAFSSALEAATIGSAQNILVIASDCRLGFPKSDDEQLFGDGAGALLIGKSGVIATVEASCSISDEIVDVWRKDRDFFVHSWEDRWVRQFGYMKNMKEVISLLFGKTGLRPSDLSKVLLYSPDGRSQNALAKELGFNIQKQVGDPLISHVGNTGTASPLLLLVSALEEGHKDNLILLVGYGDGADASVLRITGEVEGKKDRRGVKVHLLSKRFLSSYEKYLAFRDIVPTEPVAPFSVDSASTMMWRDRNWVLRFHGSQCHKCGMVTFPIQRICYGCRSKDDFDEVRLSDRKAKIFTFSLDYLPGLPDPPVIQVILELDGQTRIYCTMIDCDPRNVKIGMSVEMTFRRLREARGFYHYYWKCRPVRGEK